MQLKPYYTEELIQLLRLEFLLKETLQNNLIRIFGELEIVFKVLEPQKLPKNLIVAKLKS